jgi:L-alanine-DL-glutamate epimerase-like enolase superfamily enzyme
MSMTRRKFMRLGTVTAGLAAAPGPGSSAEVQDGRLRDDLEKAATAPLLSVKGVLKVPTSPGLGVTIDPTFLKTAVRLS